MKKVQRKRPSWWIYYMVMLLLSPFVEKAIALIKHLGHPFVAILIAWASLIIVVFAPAIVGLMMGTKDQNRAG